MEKGRGKGTDTLQTDEVFARKEYIEREAAYNTLTGYYHHSTDIQHEALREALGRVPAADVVPVRHGWWKKQGGGFVKCTSCMVLSFNADSPVDWNYCPNCGALMDKDGDRK